MDCPTKKIVSPVTEDNPLGYVVINAEDFKDGEHRLFVDPSDEAAPAKDVHKKHGTKNA